MSMRLPCIPPPNTFTRRMILWLGTTDFLTLVEGRAVLEGLPEDATFVAFDTPFDRMALGIHVVSEAFPECGLTDRLPRLSYSYRAESSRTVFVIEVPE